VLATQKSADTSKPDLVIERSIRHCHQRVVHAARAGPVCQDKSMAPPLNQGQQVGQWDRETQTFTNLQKNLVDHVAHC
jgi:hypothetical protein